jgi:ATP-dependent Clp protease protease subunit
MTPYILEEREMRVTQMDIFSRLMRDRLLWVAGGVDDRMSTVVQAQLMYLDSSDKTDITMHIDSPGGSVKSGLSMVDVMNYISCDIRTVNTGMAASMGAVLLCAGQAGKRTGLKHSRVMIHQPLGGARGQASDIEITAREIQKLKKELYDIIATHSGKTYDQVWADSDRDYWMIAGEAKEYGMIDEVLERKA